MGRKIKNIALLVFLLVLIYYQHSPALHAENRRGNGNTELESDIVPEFPPEPVREYQVEISEADGRNGYYVTAPEVEICHVSKSGSTVYSLKHGEEERKGILSQEGEKVRFFGEQFGEGLNVLTIYMEDAQGVRLEEYVRTVEFWIDRSAPVFEVSVPAGFDAWYPDEVLVSVSAYDGEDGSQIASISCCCGNQIAGTVYEASGSFLINAASLHNEGTDVTITVSDKAGNKSEHTRKVYIDNSPPFIDMKGIRDYMITAARTDVAFRIEEENMLQAFQAEIEWEDADGKKEYLPEVEWTGEGGIKEACVTCAEDGIYRMKIYAEDVAGHTAEKEAQIIIDSQDPVIRYVDQLEGQFMKKFRWDYEKDAFIQDFTTYQYQIRLDGKLYSVGEEVREEGRHNLRVEAVDSAGNKSEAAAEFVIDRTPPDIIFSNIKDGEKYEEEKTFAVVTGNPEDEIQEIRINGILKPPGLNRTSEEYTVDAYGYYEVAVKAADRAGNETVSSIAFEIVQEETVMQKVIKPLQRMLAGEKQEKKVERKREEKKENIAKKHPAGTLKAVLGCCACTAGVLWIRRSYKKYVYSRKNEGKKN